MLKWMIQEKNIKNVPNVSYSFREISNVPTRPYNVALSKSTTMKAYLNDAADRVQ